MSEAVGIKAHLLALSDGHVYKIKKVGKSEFPSLNTF